MRTIRPPTQRRPWQSRWAVRAPTILCSRPASDTILNFKPQQDTIELDHFAAVQTAQQLQAAITSDAHGNAVIGIGNHDLVTVHGVTAAQLQAIAQSAIHLS